MIEILVLSIPPEEKNAYVYPVNLHQNLKKFFAL